tara:strand:+ start:32 stop:529 length:498 start_codon:yes stop_codon:yes gene_type:complete
MKNNITAIYPGTFDPLTFGHLDLIRRGSELFDKIIIAVAENNNKNTLFNSFERKSIIEAVVNESLPKNQIEIKIFSGLLVDFVEKQKAKAVIRGLRVLSDFDYEFQMAGINSRLSNKFQTVFLMASENQQFVASRYVKEIFSLNGDISSFVPEIVLKYLKSKNNN